MCNNIIKEEKFWKNFFSVVSNVDNDLLLLFFFHEILIVNYKNVRYF